MAFTPYHFKRPRCYDLPIGPWAGVENKIKDPVFQHEKQGLFVERQREFESERRAYHPRVRYWCMESEAFLPAPIARMTVAEPVTISPPAHTPFFVVLPVSGSAMM